MKKQILSGVLAAVMLLSPAYAAESGASELILAHLSRENNTPQRAWDTVQRRLNTVEAEVLLEVAPRSEVSLPYGMEVAVCSE